MFAQSPPPQIAPPVPSPTLLGDEMTMAADRGPGEMRIPASDFTARMNAYNLSREYEIPQMKGKAITDRLRDELNKKGLRGFNRPEEGPDRP